MFIFPNALQKILRGTQAPFPVLRETATSFPHNSRLAQPELPEWAQISAIPGLVEPHGSTRLVKMALNYLACHVLRIRRAHPGLPRFG